MIIKNLLLLSLTFLLISGCKDDPKSLSDSHSVEDIYFNDYEIPREKWGYMDKKGHTAISPIYDDVRDMKSTITAVNLKGKWGYIDRQGNKVIDFKYKQVHDFNENDDRSIVQDFNNNWLLINDKGVIIDSLSYNDYKPYVGSYCPVSNNGQWGVMDRTGKEIIKPGYNNLKIKDNIFIVKKDELYGVISIDGTALISFEHDKISLSQSNTLRIKKNGTYSFYSTDTYKKVSPDYVYASPIIDGYFYARDIDDRYTIYDSLFQQVHKSTNDKVEYANDSIWKYKRNGLWGLMDVSGQEITKPKFELMNKFQEGLILYSINDLWGYIDKQGEIFIPAEMPIAWDFKDGLARVLLRRGTGFIDKDKTLVIEDKVFEVRDFYNGLARFQTM